jgi:hypothetical protein
MDTTQKLTYIVVARDKGLIHLTWAEHELVQATLHGRRVHPDVHPSVTIDEIYQSRINELQNLDI